MGSYSNIDYLAAVERNRERLLSRKEYGKVLKKTKLNFLSKELQKKIDENNRHKTLRGVIWSKKDLKQQKAQEDTIPLLRWL